MNRRPQHLEDIFHVAVERRTRARLDGADGDTPTGYDEFWHIVDSVARAVQAAAEASTHPNLRALTSAAIRHFRNPS